jgi:phosphatidylglycerol:prolipoprotein diacylglycerol transferase
MTIFFRRTGIPWLRGADAVAPAIVLGQAIGRIGCQLSGDGDWGVETTLPWGMAYRHAVVCSTPPCTCGPQGECLWPAGVFVHPTPLYECLAYFAIFAILWRLRREPAPAGTILAAYLVLSGTARFLVEFVRINPPILFGLTEAQLMSLLVMTLGGLYLLATRAWRPATA